MAPTSVSAETGISYPSGNAALACVGLVRSSLRSSSRSSPDFPAVDRAEPDAPPSGWLPLRPPALPAVAEVPAGASGRLHAVSSRYVELVLARWRLGARPEPVEVAEVAVECRRVQDQQVRVVVGSSPEGVCDAAGDEDEGPGAGCAGGAVEIELRGAVEDPERLDAIRMTMR